MDRIVKKSKKNFDQKKKEFIKIHKSYITKIFKKFILELKIL